MTELGPEEGAQLYEEMFEQPDSDHLRRIDVRQWKVSIALNDPAALTLDRPIGVFVHLFYEDLADEIARYLALIALPKQIYVSTTSEEKKLEIRRAFDRYNLDAPVQISIVPNRGRDIAPLFIEFGTSMRQHDVCLKLHGKRSLHTPDGFGDAWRSYLYSELIGTTERVRSIVHTMTVNRGLGVVLPQHYADVQPYIGIGPNYELMQRILAKISLRLLPDQEIEFPSGSMFWFRSEALVWLSDLGLDWSDFRDSPDARDGTLSHAIERSILFFCAHAGKEWAFLPSSALSGALQQ